MDSIRRRRRGSGAVAPGSGGTPGKLDPHVEDVLDLEHAADAIAAVEAGHAKGKVVIHVTRARPSRTRR